MAYVSQNPYSGETTRTFASWTRAETQQRIVRVATAQARWAGRPFEHRARVLTKAGELLRERRDQYAQIITEEMGKLVREARAEVEKCALACDYYAVHGRPFLEEEMIRTDAGRSYVAYLPIGTVLGVMPWNFPFWQIFRFAAGALMAGNACVVKPASNVPQCGQAIESVLRDAGLPEDVYVNAFIEASAMEDAIAHPLIHAVTLTGSEQAGRTVAAVAGKHLKKCVLELGGSDPFIVLHDADLDLAASQAVASRFINCGQSCIAAKRFIVVPEIADEFVALFQEKAATLALGDPSLESTGLGPMARRDLREEVHEQVREAIGQGARVVLGCEPSAAGHALYPASILDGITPAMRVYREEVFGPVALVIRAESEADAVRIANESAFGLGSSIWSRDYERAETLALAIEAGCTFVNGIVRSDPRLPFGGIKNSGYGRELSYHGIREFTNTKTVWIREGYTGAERRQVSERRQGSRRQGDGDGPPLGE